MLVAEGRRFLLETNMLAAVSLTRFPRILSYGLANPKTMNEINSARRIDVAQVASIS